MPQWQTGKMAKKGIAEYLASNRGLSNAAQNRLRQLVERYPYFHAARLLYLRSLFHNHDISFHIELRKAALYLPSRSVLYSLIEGEHLYPNQFAEKTRAAQTKQNDEEDHTISLIEQFLESIPEQAQHRQHKVDPSVDYIGFLEQSESSNAVLSTQKTGEIPPPTDVIGDFLDKGGKLGLPNRPDEELLKPLTEDGNNENTILTERLAKIYIKQRKYDKALEIIQKLSLKYPKKNRYFADQIRFLEKLITNDENK